MFKVIALTGSVGLIGATSALAEIGHYGLGHTATDAEIAGWNIDVSPSGAGLPSGSGTTVDGESLYQSQCVACHGSKGQNGPMNRLAGGQSTLASDSPVKTVGGYWPYATTLYDYIYRAMPLPTPQSLAPDQTYAVTVYVLYLSGIAGRDETLEADSLPKVEMPNRDGFMSPDPRPDTDNRACETDCQQAADKRADR